MSSDLVDGRDTIVARATASGRGALAVVRLSGGELAKVAAVVCPDADLARPWQAQLVEVRGGGGEVLDRAIVTAYAGPRSYTGEDMLEVVVHGSPYLVRALVDGCVAAGAREAGPGEFTRRALANGKLDLLQAEAIADLIEAETVWQARNAGRQLAGELSREVAGLRRRVIELLAAIEAGLEFSEQGAAETPRHLAELRDDSVRAIEAVLSTAAAGERIRHGARVVIVGAPNSGKSTLFNRLLAEERAIVSPQPGTTRDLVEAEIELAGVVVTLVDTAGLSTDTSDAVEAEGVRRARAALEEAALAVLLWASDSALEPEIPLAPPLLRVRSKVDLAAAAGTTQDGWLPVSCVTGQGIDELRTILAQKVAVDGGESWHGVAIGARHGERLKRAADELRGCQLDRLEVAAEGVRWALRELAEITGEVVDEEVLDAIFARFCVGK